MEKAALYIDPDSDVHGSFLSVLLVEDRPDQLNLYARHIQSNFKGVLVAACKNPLPASGLLEKCYCDVLVADMNLGSGISGDKLIEKAKSISKLTVTCAVTGYESEYGYFAGKCGTDLFLKKSSGIDVVYDGISKSIKMVHDRQDDFQKKYGHLLKPKIHWKEAEKVKKECGFTTVVAARS